MTSATKSRPAYRIVANGRDVTDALQGRVKSILVTDAAGYSSDSVELELADTDDDKPVDIPLTGTELEIWLGYANGVGVQRMGLYVADEIELAGWPGVMLVRGRAAPYESSKGGKSDLQTQKVRNWPNGTKLSAMVAKIAKEHGLEPAVAKSLASITLPHFDQTEESDISFLVRVGRKYDAVVKPGGGKLAVVKFGEAESASGKELAAITLRAEDCTRWSANMSARESDGTVVAYYHDRAAAQRQFVEVGSGDPVRRLRHNFPNKESAENAAKAEYDKRNRRKHGLSVTVPGDSQLSAEVPLRLEGFRNGVPVDWVVSRVVHRFEAGSGYSCDLEAEAPTA